MKRFLAINQNESCIPNLSVITSFGVIFGFLAMSPRSDINLIFSLCIVVFLFIHLKRKLLTLSLYITVCCLTLIYLFNQAKFLFIESMVWTALSLSVISSMFSVQWMLLQRKKLMHILLMNGVFTVSLILFMTFKYQTWLMSALPTIYLIVGVFICGNLIMIKKHKY